MFGAYVSNKELMTVYFLIIVFMLVINLVILLAIFIRAGHVASKIELRSSSISGRGNIASRN